MLKKLAGVVLGAVLCAAASSAFALTGNIPNNGFGLADGQWLNGMAGGTNRTYQSGIAAAGTTQATATQLQSGIALFEVDTVGASSGVALPACVAGTEVKVYNSTATTLTYYPAIANNTLTGAQDTINGGTSKAVTSASGGTLTIFTCAKNGAWGAR